MARADRWRKAVPKGVVGAVRAGAVTECLISFGAHGDAAFCSFENEQERVKRKLGVTKQDTVPSVLSTPAGQGANRLSEIWALQALVSTLSIQVH